MFGDVPFRRRNNNHFQPTPRKGWIEVNSKGVVCLLAVEGVGRGVKGPKSLKRIEDTKRWSVTKIEVPVNSATLLRRIWRRLFFRGFHKGWNGRNSKCYGRIFFKGTLGVMETHFPFFSGLSNSPTEKNMDLNFEPFEKSCLKGCHPETIQEGGSCKRVRLLDVHTHTILKFQACTATRWISARLRKKWCFNFVE